MKQYTASELDKFLAWIKDKPIQMRFIELMQTGEMDHFFHAQHLSGQSVMERLLREGWQLQNRALSDGPAKVLHHPDYLGEIGLIMPYEKNFCHYLHIGDSGVRNNLASIGG